MNLLTKLFMLLLIAGFYVPAQAETADTNLVSCSVFSADEGDKKTEGGEEEEPDCE